MPNVVKEFKVAYWNDGNILQSKMFENLQDANDFVSSLSSEYLSTIMQLESNIQGEYSWKVLPISIGRFIPFTTMIYRHRWMILLLLGSSYMLTKEVKR